MTAPHNQTFFTANTPQVTPRLASMKLNVAAQAIALFQKQAHQNVTKTHQNEPETAEKPTQDTSGQPHQDVAVFRQSESQSAEMGIDMRVLPGKNVQGNYNFHFNTADPCALCFAKLCFEIGLIPFESQPPTMQSLKLSDPVKHDYMIYATVNICLKRLIKYELKYGDAKDFDWAKLSILVGFWKALVGKDINLEDELTVIRLVSREQDVLHDLLVEQFGGSLPDLEE